MLDKKDVKRVKKLLIYVKSASQSYLWQNTPQNLFFKAIVQEEKS